MFENFEFAVLCSTYGLQAKAKLIEKGFLLLNPDESQNQIFFAMSELKPEV